MKNLLIIFFSALLLFGCKTPHYYTLPVNQASFANKGEVQLSGSLGSPGAGVKGGVAVTDRISVAGQYNGPIGGEYSAREWEGAFGFKIGDIDGSKVHTLFAGYGMGSNSKLDSGAALPDYYGDYTRGFIQYGIGSTQGHIGKRVRVGNNAALKLNYIDYKGFKESSGIYNRFTASNYFLEMYGSANIGGKYWRFEYGMAFVIKTDFRAINSPAHNLRVFPMHFNVALQIIIGRKYKTIE